MTLKIEIKNNKNYIHLENTPLIPDYIIPTREQCLGFEFLTMVQFCRIAKAHGIGSSRACNAFGGDRGKYSVISERMARENGGRKYVLIHAVDQYFKEMGIKW